MGGGSSGKIAYPSYIAVIHGEYLDHDTLDHPTKSITDVFNETIANNPFTGELAFNPDDELTRSLTDITALRDLVNAIDPAADYDAALIAMELSVDNVVDDAYITGPIPTVPVDDSALADDVNSYAAIQNQLLENTVLPPWKAGMHNINAVTSSAFVIGEAILRGMNQNDIARYSATVRSQIVAKNNELNAGFISQRQDMITKFNVQRNEMIRSLSESMIGMLIRKNELLDAVALRSAAYSQILIAAKFDEKDAQLNIDESEVKWEMSLFQPVGSFIGAMQGGGAAPGVRRPSRGASIAAGAVSGAASGAVTGASMGGYGAVYGAVIGAALGAGTAALQTS